MRIDVDFLLEETAAELGLDDYGDPSFRDGLEALTDAGPAAMLTPLGEAVFNATIRQALANRLRVTNWHATQLQVPAHESDVGIIIVGLPRTGTTVLSHLLGIDPANRSLRSWEANESVPPPTTATYWTDPRYQRAMTTPRALDQLNPSFRAIHHDSPEEPVECAVALAQHFASVSYSTMFNIASYDRWLVSADLSRAYQYHRQVLGVLDSQCPGPWQLKSPAHGYGMEAVAAIYPKALFVQPHRDPVRSIASACSLTAALSGTFTDHDFRPYIAEHWPELMATILDRVVDYRDRHGDDRFIDLAYHEIVNDPIACVRRIYGRLGRELAPNVETVMQEHLATATPHRYGRHDYSLAEFGLSREPLENRLAGYLDRFDVPREQV